MRYRLIILSLHLCMFFTLVFGYENYIFPMYAYEGYLFQPDAANGYAAISAIVVLSLITPTAYQRPSTLFYQLTLVVIIIPTLVLFYVENKSWEYPARALAAYAFSVLLAPFLNIKPPRLSFVSEDILLRALLLVVTVYIASVFLLGGAAYLNFDFSKVYDFRAEAASNLPWPFNYFTPLMGKVVVPIGMVLSLIFKKYTFALLHFIFAILIFGLTSHKSTFFVPLEILFFYAIAGSKNLTPKFNFGMLVLLLLAIADYWMMESHGDSIFGWVGTLVLVRAFTLPAEINYMYYDFFTRNDWIFFSDSKMTLGLLEYKYPLDVPHMIGREFFNNEMVGANTGWLGSGYAQMGFAGMLLYAALTAMIFNYVDTCARNSGEGRLITASIIVPIASLITSSDLPTTLLTHGLLLNLILIACLRGRRAMPPYYSPESAVNYIFAQSSFPLKGR